MSWRKHILNWTGPGILGGITVEKGIALLRENRFAVHPRYWWRATVITMGSVRNSIGRRREDAAFAERVGKTVVEAPIFLLGIWRSGTTHLQNLFAVDHRFALPSWFQVSYPHRFLLAGSSASPFERWFVPRERLQDNMEFGFDLPGEEEFALCAATGCSPLLSWVFPDQAMRYDRYLTMRDATAAETAAWKRDFLYFVKKLTFQSRKQLVLKSPPQTARIRLLLELFPDARFVHICRNPYAVYPSIVQMLREVLKYCALQSIPFDIEERALRQYAEIFDAYFEEKELIPSNRLCEIRYEDLEQDPLREMRKVYSALALPDFREVEPDLRRYIASQAGYRKQSYAELPVETKVRIVRLWQRSFDAWKYAS